MNTSLWRNTSYNAADGAARVGPEAADVWTAVPAYLERWEEYYGDVLRTAESGNEAAQAGADSRLEEGAADSDTSAIASNANLAKLPNELLIDIIQHVLLSEKDDEGNSGVSRLQPHDIEVLKDLRLVCKSLKEGTTKFLFQNIGLPVHGMVAIQTMEGLIKSGFLQHLRRLDIPIGLMTPDASIENYADHESELRSLFTDMLANCLNPLPYLSVGTVVGRQPDDIHLYMPERHHVDLFYTLIGDALSLTRADKAVTMLEVIVPELRNLKDILKEPYMKHVETLFINVYGPPPKGWGTDEESPALNQLLSIALSWPTNLSKLAICCSRLIPTFLPFPTSCARILTQLTLINMEIRFPSQLRRTLSRMANAQDITLSYIAVVYRLTCPWSDILKTLEAHPHLQRLHLSGLHYCRQNPADPQPSPGDMVLPNRNWMPLFQARKQDYISAWQLAEVVIGRNPDEDEDNYVQLESMIHDIDMCISMM